MDGDDSVGYCSHMDRFEQSASLALPQAALVRESGSVDCISPSGHHDPDTQVTSVIAVVSALTRSVRERADVILSQPREPAAH